MEQVLLLPGSEGIGIVVNARDDGLVMSMSLMMSILFTLFLLPFWEIERMHAPSSSVHQLECVPLPLWISRRRYSEREIHMLAPRHR